MLAKTKHYFGLVFGLKLCIGLSPKSQQNLTSSSHVHCRPTKRE